MADEKIERIVQLNKDIRNGFDELNGLAYEEWKFYITQPQRTRNAISTMRTKLNYLDQMLDEMEELYEEMQNDR